jgi:hypothetical protein
MPSKSFTCKEYRVQIKVLSAIDQESGAGGFLVSARRYSAREIRDGYTP